MSKKKTQTTQQQTNTYGWQNVPETADVTALRGMKAQADPTIPYQFAKRREDLRGSYNRPLGSYTSPAVKEAADRAATNGLNMAEGQALAESNQQADSINYARQAALAEMTAPRMVQTGGTSTGTQTQSGGFWGGLLQSAVGGAASGFGGGYGAGLA